MHGFNAHPLDWVSEDAGVIPKGWRKHMAFEKPTLRPSESEFISGTSHPKQKIHYGCPKGTDVSPG